MLDPIELGEMDWYESVLRIASVPGISGLAINTTSLSTSETFDCIVKAREALPVAIYVPLGLLSRYAYLGIPIYYDLSAFWVPSVNVYKSDSSNPFFEMRENGAALYDFLTSPWATKQELGSPIPQRDLRLIESGDFDITLVWDVKTEGKGSYVGLLSYGGFLDLIRKFGNTRVGIRSLERLPATWTC
jgi:hypothetical protein